MTVSAGVPQCFILGSLLFLSYINDLFVLTNYLQLPAKFINLFLRVWSLRVFLDISKAFSKVWHEILLLKLNQNGISGNLLKLLRDFLSCLKQRVVLSGQHSPWDNVTAGVPWGSVLGPLLFLIYINDLLNDLSSNCKLFADDSKKQ